MKFAFGNLNVKFTKPALLKHRFPNANAKLVPLVKDARHAPLYTGPSSPAFLKRLYPDAIINNTRTASLLSRDARLSFRSHDARIAFMSLVSLNLASQLGEARMPPALNIARLISLIPLPWI